MPKLKTFQTSIGFFDLAVAAPSMKAAAEAWGSDPAIFRQGFAKQTDEPGVVEATMAKPGVVLRRPAGSGGAFTEHASLPTLGPDRNALDPSNRQRTGSGDAQAKKAEAELERVRKRRERRIAKADASLERARLRHEQALRSIEKRRAQLARDEADEEERWRGEQQAHQEALKETKA